eukprot:Gb_34711 [translate_table: standard]
MDGDSPMGDPPTGHLMAQDHIVVGGFPRTSGMNTKRLLGSFWKQNSNRQWTEKEKRKKEQQNREEERDRGYQRVPKPGTGSQWITEDTHKQRIQKDQQQTNRERKGDNKGSPQRRNNKFKNCVPLYGVQDL